MQKIASHLWFDKEAKEAAAFYTSVFPDSKITNTTTIHGTPSGDCDVVSFELSGLPFMAISAGPVFKLNPSVSFLVACATKEEASELWNKLSPGGKTLMELGSYPFSEHYGWTEDTYGVSWQIMYVGNYPFEQKITPTMMFVGKVCGKAEEAINFYCSVFKNSTVGNISRYSAGQAPDVEGTVTHASFTLEGQQFAAMDSAAKHNFAFNEAVSFVVHCDTQDEIDYYWNKLSAVPAAEQCGWLKDKYGFSWQIVPSIMNTIFAENNPEKIARMTKAFLQMKKFDIAKLEEATNA